MSSRHTKIARIKDEAFKYLGLFSTFFGLVMLAIFISSIFSEGISRISWEFITNYPSRTPEKAGILSASAGTLWIIVMTACSCNPIGNWSGNLPGRVFQKIENGKNY